MVVIDLVLVLEADEKKTSFLVLIRQMQMRGWRQTFPWHLPRSRPRFTSSALAPKFQRQEQRGSRSWRLLGGAVCAHRADGLQARQRHACSARKVTPALLSRQSRVTPVGAVASRVAVPCGRVSHA